MEVLCEIAPAHRNTKWTVEWLGVAAAEILCALAGQLRKTTLEQWTRESMCRTVRTDTIAAGDNVITSFFAIVRNNNGIYERDIRVPIYARRKWNAAE